MYILFFRKCSVCFNLVFLKHLTHEPCLFLANGICLGKLLLYTEARSHSIPDCGTELFQESVRRCAAPGDFVGVPHHRPAPQDASCGGGSLGRILCSLVGDWETEGATHGLGLDAFCALEDVWHWKVLGPTLPSRKLVDTWRFRF